MISKRLRYLVILILFLTGFAIPDFHPEIKWMEISSEKFKIIFPEGYKKFADYSLDAANELFPIIKEFWKSDVNGKIRILLHDSTDCFEEESTFFPYNQIRVSMYPPEPHSIFGNYTDHIKDVIRHGLNRIFVYNQGSKMLRFFRRYFGANSIFFPTLFIPGWTLAGVSAYEEINAEDETRFHSPEFSLILNSLASGKGLPPLSSLKSRKSEWPGQFSNIIFGAGLIKFLSDDFKGEKIREFVRHYSANPLPVDFKCLFNPRVLSMSERFRIVFGKRIDEVWEELEEKGRIEAENSPGGNLMTNSGFIKKYTVYIPDYGIIYFGRDFKSFPGLFVLKKGRRKGLRLLRRSSVKGISYSKESRKLYFSAVDTYRKHYRYADLFSYDLKTGKSRRLTRGARLTYPVRSGDRIYCIKRDKNGSSLAYIKAGGDEVTRISDKYIFMTGLTISPDSRYIAASVKNETGNWKIGVFNMEGDLQGFVEYVGKRAFSPVWKNSNELMFVTSLEKNFYLTCFNMDLGELQIYRHNKISPFKYFDIIDNETLIAPVLTENGYDISKIDIGGFSPEVRVYSFSQPKRRRSLESGAMKKARKYRPFRDLSPKYFTPAFREGGNETQAGIYASGFDLLNKNKFKLKVFTGLKSGKVNLYLDYSYNRFPFEMNFRYSRYTDMNRSEEMGGFFKVANKFIISSLFPLSVSSEGEVHFYTDIHFEKETDDYIGNFENYVTDFNGFRAGIRITSTQEYFNSISENDGFNFNAVWSKEFKFMGSNAELTSFVLEYTQFIPVYKINTIALRAAFGISNGDKGGRFLMGGVSSGGELSYSGEKLFGILRSYPSGFFSGDTGFSLNLEYRFLLKKIERAFFIFKSIESLYATFYTDMGSVWDSGKKPFTAFSAGAELNLILYLGTYKYILSSGLGYGNNPEKKPVFYFRLGASF